MSFCVFEKLQTNKTFLLINIHFNLNTLTLKVCIWYIFHTPNTDCISLICRVMNSVLSRPSDGDEPVTVTELLAAEPVWKWDFLWGSEKDTGQHDSGESKQSLDFSFNISI